MRGYSLIELMVVLAIMAFLAALAAPIYRSYQNKAKLGSVVPVVEMLVHDSIQFASDQGYFPNANELSYSTTTGDNNVTTPSQFGTMWQNATIQMGDGTFGGSAEQVCGRHGYIAGTWPAPYAASLFTYSDSSTAVNWVCAIWHNGAVDHKCFYAITTNSGTTSLVGDYLPGWTNENTTAGNDHNNLNNLYNSAVYQNATCQ